MNAAYWIWYGHWSHDHTAALAACTRPAQSNTTWKEKEDSWEEEGAAGLRGGVKAGPGVNMVPTRYEHVQNCQNNKNEQLSIVAMLFL